MYDRVWTEYSTSDWGKGVEAAAEKPAPKATRKPKSKPTARKPKPARPDEA